MAFLCRLPLEGNSVGPMWPGSVGLAGAAPMPHCWPAGQRHTPLPSHCRPHWQRPCSGHPSRLVAAVQLGTDTDPDTGVACQLVRCWLYPAGRLAHVGPVRPCPAYVACAGCVLPSRPSPCRGLSPPLRTLRAKTPQGHPVGCPPSWPRACTEREQEPLGLPKCFDISLPYGLQDTLSTLRPSCSPGVSP